jgi:hypothetical protein
LLLAVRVVGGPILLSYLNAPGWALADWLMVHISINLKPTRRRGGSS